MSFILRLKHWQIFPIILIGATLYGFTIEGDQKLTTTLTVTGGIIYFLWPLLVGHELYQFLPNKIQLNYHLFILNSFIWMTAFVTTTIISDAQGMTFHGIAVLPGFYVAYTFLHLIMFPARVLKSIEKGTKADIGECIGDFFLIIFLPFGIWFLQPRINKVTEKLKDDLITD